MTVDQGLCRLAATLPRDVRTAAIQQLVSVAADNERYLCFCARCAPEVALQDVDTVPFRIVSKSTVYKHYEEYTPPSRLRCFVGMFVFSVREACDAFQASFDAIEEFEHDMMDVDDFSVDAVEMDAVEICGAQVVQSPGGTIAKRGMQQMVAATLEYTSDVGGGRVAPMQSLHKLDVLANASPLVFCPSNEVIVTPTKLHGRADVDLSRHSDLYVSIAMHFLGDETWPHAERLQELHEWFVMDGGQSVFMAHGVEGKWEALADFRNYVWFLQPERKPWVKERRRREGLISERDHNLVLFPNTAKVANRCSIGDYKMRSKHLDTKSTTASYFMAKVDDGGGEYHFEPGRATRFLLVRHPGASLVDEDTVLVQCEWLITTHPNVTSVSKSPMVMLDNKDDRYRSDIDISDGFITRVWPAHAILPHDTFLAPLDECHDVPPRVKVCTQDPNMAHDFQRKYGGNKDPSKVCIEKWLERRDFVLAAVVMKHSGIGEKSLQV